jgi:hypothetical protein
VLDGPSLLRIEGLKVVGGHRHGSNRPFTKESQSLIPVLFATTSLGSVGGRATGVRIERGGTWHHYDPLY